MMKTEFDLFSLSICSPFIRVLHLKNVIKMKFFKVTFLGVLDLTDTISLACHPLTLTPHNICSTQLLSTVYVVMGDHQEDILVCTCPDAYG